MEDTGGGYERRIREEDTWSRGDREEDTGLLITLQLFVARQLFVDDVTPYECVCVSLLADISVFCLFTS